MDTSSCRSTTSPPRPARNRASRWSTIRPRLGAAATVLDVHAYVEDFNSTVVEAYRRGVADVELPADDRRRPQHHPAGDRRDPRLQRPGAAHPRVRSLDAVRRLHDLRQRLPRHRDPRHRSCPSRDGRAAIDRVRRRRSRTRPGRRRRPRSHFAHTHEVRATSRAQARPRAGRVRHLRRPDPLQGLRRVRRGLPRARLRRAPDDRQGRAIEARRRAHARALSPATCASSARCPPTPAGLSQREGARRPHARRARHRLRRRRRLVRRLRRGARPSGCSSPRPARSTARSRWASWPRPAATPSSAAPTRTTRTSCRGPTRSSRTPRRSPSASARRWDQAGHPDRRLWVIGGDGAMYDIGFQSLSRMVASGADIKVLVLDTQVYSNTGGQASTAIVRRPGHQAVGLRQGAPRPARATQGARPDPDRPRRGLRRPDDAGPHQPLLPGDHGGQRVSRARPSSSPTPPACPSTASPTTRPTAQAKLAVDSRAFPLFTYDPRRGERHRRAPVACRAIRPCKDDWERLPDGTPVDFLAFARTEGRFAGHFGPDGTPSAEIVATQADRLANWRTLQELAGLLPAAGPRPPSRPD